MNVKFGLGYKMLVHENMGIKAGNTPTIQLKGAFYGKWLFLEATHDHRNSQLKKGNREPQKD